MGHLLKSINPEAAEAIRPAPAKDRLPGVGDLVIYNMRAGHGRQGRTRFPAIVQENARGVDRGLSMTVVMEAGELLNVTLVEAAKAGADGGHTWEWPDMSFATESIRNMATSAHTRIGALEDEVAKQAGEVAALRKLILGDFDVPRISIIEIMQDFENRLRLKAEPGKGKSK